jgi:hypothetical protein
MSDSFSQSLLKALISLAEEGVIERAPRSYSGRGMYGKQCIGVTTDTSEFELGVRLMDHISNSSHMDVLDLDLLINVSSDSMGRSVIIYWPGTEWEDSFDDMVAHLKEDM